jgi:hypothetical protein
MKATDTSTNFMLVVFCFVLLGFVFLSGKMLSEYHKKQKAVETNSLVH